MLCKELEEFQAYLKKKQEDRTAEMKTFFS